MSAWYIFSAMGFYPVNPVSGEYVVGSPLFEHIRLKLRNPSSTKTISLTGTLVRRGVAGDDIDSAIADSCGTKAGDEATANEHG